MTLPFVVLEGLSGTGKTSIAVELAGVIGGTYVHTPTSPYRDVRAEVDAHASFNERYFFYVAALARAATKIHEELVQRPVICDRWVATTQHWHALLGVPVLESLDFLGLPQPVLTVLVICDEDTRQGRLDRRGRSGNDLMEANSGLEGDLLDLYRAQADVQIDSTYDSPIRLAKALAASIRAAAGAVCL